MRIGYSRCVCIGILVGFGILSAAADRRSAVTLLVDTQHPSVEIPADFSGLSFEMEKLLPDKSGGYYFSASNAALIQTFRNLGVASLRVGGNTADTPAVPLPNSTDIDSLFAFAKAVRVGVIFTFRLRAGGPQNAAPMAKHMVDRYRSSIVCFAIGNEPDVYTKTYPAYRAELERYMAVFRKSGISPSVKFCGPGTTPSKAEWARKFARDFGHSGRIRYVTQHAYPGHSGRKVTDPVAGRSALLSRDWVSSYESFYESFAPAAEKNRLPFRLEETNSFFHGGAKDVSDTFASALWGLDYMHWWASHGAAGINFHTGEEVAAADEDTPCFYAVFLPSGHGYTIQPLGYAMKAFDLGGHGRVVPVHFTSDSSGLNLTAYGVLSMDNTLYLTLINKEHGSVGRDAVVTVIPGKMYRRGELVRLESSTGDIAAKAGLTLGGVAIQENGAWHGVWKSVKAGVRTGEFEIGVPAQSAAILRFTADLLPK